MPISMNWDNTKKTIIRFDISGKWAWKDYYSIIDRSMQRHQEEHYPPTHIIWNMLPGCTFPSHPLVHARRSLKQLPSGTMVVIVNQSQFVRVLVQALTQMTETQPIQLRYAENLQEARRYITQHQARETAEVNVVSK